ncbi:winged helix-turn-helix domain-containing protein [Actinomadura rudentiformis]|uniref:winged helix-turn-helix domain-containing protein n=1 Tax=Actinomadura rudentiformis TaxID=359158 RepID=UPI001CEF5CAC|nr:winged helix-turn-helix domain-containing protein [Actinomadura rudentiformis]
MEKWRRAWREGGVEALRSKRPHRRTRLDDAAFARLEAELNCGPAAHGYGGDQRWTLGRVTALIRRLFGIDYSLPGVSLLLRRNGWSVQVAGRRATERDDHAVQVWKRAGVAAGGRTAADLGAWICFLDETGEGRRPPKGGSWSRRGHRPQVRVHGGDHGGRVSVAGMVCYLASGPG